MAKESEDPLGQAVAKIQQQLADEASTVASTQISEADRVKKINTEYQSLLAPLENRVLTSQTPTEFQKLIQDFEERVQRMLRVKFTKDTVFSWQGIETASYDFTFSSYYHRNLTEKQVTENRKLVLEMIKDGKINKNDISFEVMYHAKPSGRDAETYFFGYKSTNNTLQWFLGEYETGNYSDRSSLSLMADSFAAVIVQNQLHKLTVKPGPLPGNDW